MPKKSKFKSTAAFVAVIASLGLMASPATAAPIDFIVEDGSFIRINTETFDVGTDDGTDPSWTPPIVSADITEDPNDACIENIDDIVLDFRETDLGNGVTAQVENATGDSLGTGNTCTGDVDIDLNVRVRLTLPSGFGVTSPCFVGGVDGIDLLLQGNDYSTTGATIGTSNFNVPAVTGCGLFGNIIINSRLGLDTTNTEASFILSR